MNSLTMTASNGEISKNFSNNSTIVTTWLKGIGLEYACEIFDHAGIVTPQSLAELDVSFFQALGITNADDRRKLFYLVQRIKMQLLEEETHHPHQQEVVIVQEVEHQMLSKAPLSSSLLPNRSAYTPSKTNKGSPKISPLQQKNEGPVSAITTTTGKRIPFSNNYYHDDEDDDEINIQLGSSPLAVIKSKRREIENNRKKQQQQQQLKRINPSSKNLSISSSHSKQPGTVTTAASTTVTDLTSIGCESIAGRQLGGGELHHFENQDRQHHFYKEERSLDYRQNNGDDGEADHQQYGSIVAASKHNSIVDDDGYNSYGSSSGHHHDVCSTTTDDDEKHYLRQSQRKSDSYHLDQQKLEQQQPQRRKSQRIQEKKRLDHQQGTGKSGPTTAVGGTNGANGMNTSFTSTSSSITARSDRSKSTGGRRSIGSNATTSAVGNTPTNRKTHMTANELLFNSKSKQIPTSSTSSYCGVSSQQRRSNLPAPKVSTVANRRTGSTTIVGGKSIRTGKRLSVVPADDELPMSPLMDLPHHHQLAMVMGTVSDGADGDDTSCSNSYQNNDQDLSNVYDSEYDEEKQLYRSVQTSSSTRNVTTTRGRKSSRRSCGGKIKPPELLQRVGGGGTSQSSSLDSFDDLLAESDDDKRTQTYSAQQSFGKITTGGDPKSSRRSMDGLLFTGYSSNFNKPQGSLSTASSTNQSYQNDAINDHSQNEHHQPSRQRTGSSRVNRRSSLERPRASSSQLSVSEQSHESTYQTMNQVDRIVDNSDYNWVLSDAAESKYENQLMQLQQNEFEYESGIRQTQRSQSISRSRRSLSATNPTLKSSSQSDYPSNDCIALTNFTTTSNNSTSNINVGNIISYQGQDKEDDSFRAQISALRNENNADHELFSDDTIFEDDMRIRVVVRKRPMSSAEKLSACDVDVIHPFKCGSYGKILVYQPKTRVDLTKEVETIPFAFDNVFDEHHSNVDIYEGAVQNTIIPSFFKGQWSSIFAYGQTGSGKTYTMMGCNSTGTKTGSDNNFDNPNDFRRNLGLYYMAALDVFLELEAPEHASEGFSVRTSLFEIYSGKLFDLLSARKQVKCLEDAKGKVCFPGLSEHTVSSPDELITLIEKGASNRSTGTTSRNADSSRSHAVLQLHLRKRKKQMHHQPSRSSSNASVGAANGAATFEFSRLTFIDLAGSERGADTQSASRATRLEGAEINTSLLALKEVIRALARNDPLTHVPFRGSKLTQVLKESFVGKNSRSVMIACISPNMSNCEQTLNTLRYSDRVKERNPDTGVFQQQQHQQQSTTTASIMAIPGQLSTPYSPNRNLISTTGTNKGISRSRQEASHQQNQECHQTSTPTVTFTMQQQNQPWIASDKQPTNVHERVQRHSDACQSEDDLDGFPHCNANENGNNDRGTRNEVERNQDVSGDCDLLMHNEDTWIYEQRISKNGPNRVSSTRSTSSNTSDVLDALLASPNVLSDSDAFDEDVAAPVTKWTPKAMLGGHRNCTGFEDDTLFDELDLAIPYTKKDIKQSILEKQQQLRQEQQTIATELIAMHKEAMSYMLNMIKEEMTLVNDADCDREIFLGRYLNEVRTVHERHLEWIALLREQLLKFRIISNAAVVNDKSPAAGLQTRALKVHSMQGKIKHVHSGDDDEEDSFEDLRD